MRGPTHTNFYHLFFKTFQVSALRLNSLVLIIDRESHACFSSKHICVANLLQGHTVHKSKNKEEPQVARGPQVCTGGEGGDRTGCGLQLCSGTRGEDSRDQAKTKAPHTGHLPDLEEEDACPSPALPGHSLGPALGIGPSYSSSSFPLPLGATILLISTVGRKDTIFQAAHLGPHLQY